MSRGWLPHRIALRTMAFSRRRPGIVLAIFALLLVAAGWVASRVRVNTDILSLMPAGNTEVEAFRSTLERFGSTDLLLAIIDLEDRGGDPERLDPALAYADLLAEQLRDSDDILWLEYHREDLTQAALELVPWAPLFMSSENLDRLLTDLESDDGRRTLAAELAETVRTASRRRLSARMGASRSGVDGRVPTGVRSLTGGFGAAGVGRNCVGTEPS